MITLYCKGVMCSKPGGGTSQYSEGFLRRERCFFELDLDLLLLRSLGDLDLRLSRERER